MAMASPAVLKAWLSWFQSGFVLRLLGIPTLLLALHLEIYGSAPAATSLILHRLSSRLRLTSALACLPPPGMPRTKSSVRSTLTRSSSKVTTPAPPSTSAVKSRGAPSKAKLPPPERTMTPASKDSSGATAPAPEAPLPPVTQQQQQPPQPPSPPLPLSLPPLSPSSPHLPTSSPSLVPSPLPSPSLLPTPLADIPESSTASVTSSTFDTPAPASTIPTTPSVLSYAFHPVASSTASHTPNLSVSSTISHASTAYTTLSEGSVDSVASSAASTVSSASDVPAHAPFTSEKLSYDFTASSTSTQPSRAVVATSTPPASVTSEKSIDDLTTSNTSITSDTPSHVASSPDNVSVVPSISSAASATPVKPSYESVDSQEPSDGHTSTGPEETLHDSIAPEESSHASVKSTEPSRDTGAAINSDAPTQVIAFPTTPAPASVAPKTPSHASSRPPMSATHTRSKSTADIVRQGKRLSLQFPIQPASGSNSPSLRSRPQSYAAPSPMSSPEESSPPETNILAIVAAHERYVLELKEELAKAETDLKALKRHFALQEVNKQRNEHRKMTQLQPLNMTLANYGPDPEDEDGSALWMQKEMERKKALISGTKTSQRKVFSGSRHLRTLSLLSPDKAYTPSFPQPLDLHDGTPTSASADSPIRPLYQARHTSPELVKQRANTVNGDGFDVAALSNIQRDALLRTGKQMATDLKDGFLTFFEDIRQATVGEESAAGDESTAAIARPPPKGLRKASETRPALAKTASSKTAKSSKVGDVGDDFWKEHGLIEPSSKTVATKKLDPKNKGTAQKPTSTPKKASEFDDWDNWDTPVDKQAKVGKDADSNDSCDDADEPSSPVSGQASSRTSTRYHKKRHDSKTSSLTMPSSAGLFNEADLLDAKRNSIPWPDLVKLSPSHLKRTASHLMKEWEKNLTPPPEAREGSLANGDYIGRATSPAPPTQ